MLYIFFVCVFCFVFSGGGNQMAVQHSGAVVSTVSSQQDGSRFEPSGQLGPFYVACASIRLV